MRWHSWPEACLTGKWYCCAQTLALLPLPLLSTCLGRCQCQQQVRASLWDSPVRSELPRSTCPGGRAAVPGPRGAPGFASPPAPKSLAGMALQTLLLGPRWHWRGWVVGCGWGSGFGGGNFHLPVFGCCMLTSKSCTMGTSREGGHAATEHTPSPGLAPRHPRFPLPCFIPLLSKAADSPAYCRRRARGPLLTPQTPQCFPARWPQFCDASQHTQCAQSPSEQAGGPVGNQG